MKTQQIVLAKADPTGGMRETGQYHRPDGVNWQPIRSQSKSGSLGCDHHGSFRFAERIGETTVDPAQAEQRDRVKALDITQHPAYEAELEKLRDESKRAGVGIKTYCLTRYNALSVPDAIKLRLTHGADAVSKSGGEDAQPRKENAHAAGTPTEHDCPKCGEHFSTCICEDDSHSPLPWHATANAIYGTADSIHIAACTFRGEGQNRANAAYIVKACNAYPHAEALAKHCKALMTQLRMRGAKANDPAVVYATEALAQWERSKQ